jgi:hypothetical protein
MGNWLYTHLGIAGTGPWYGFWSGFGSDLTELGLIGMIWRAVNCHERSCLRLGHHYQGQVVCHKHRRPGR